jgi:hypothetical protein
MHVSVISLLDSHRNIWSKPSRLLGAINRKMSSMLLALDAVLMLVASGMAVHGRGLRDRTFWHKPWVYVDFIRSGALSMGGPNGAHTREQSNQNPFHVALPSH